MVHLNDRPPRSRGAACGEDVDGSHMWHNKVKRKLRNYVKTKLDITEAAFPIFFPYRAGVRSYILTFP